MCGITTLCSIQVVVSTAAVTVTGAMLVCPGDSVWLSAMNGMVSYDWMPGNIFNDSAYVGVGTYTLTVTDINGCIDSASFTVGIDSSTVPPLVSGDTVCIEITLQFCNFKWSIEWYDIPSGGNLLGTGNSYRIQMSNQIQFLCLDSGLVRMSAV